MQNQRVPFLLVILVLFSISACSTRSNSANVQSLDSRLTALEEKVFNQEEKQQSINDWTAKRLGALEAQHPNIQVPPPPGFMQKETIRPDTTNPLPPISGEVVNTVPGQASITPGKPSAISQPTGATAPKETVTPATPYQPPAIDAQTTTPPPAAAPIVQVQDPAISQPASTATAVKASPNAEKPETSMQNTPAPKPTETPKEANTPTGSQPHASAPAQTSGELPANAVAQTTNPQPASAKNLPATGLQAQGPQTQEHAPEATTATTSPAGTSDKAVYAAALSLLERGKTEQGLAAMDKFLAQFPQSSLAPNAMYWKGEALYTQLKFDDAILSFKDVVTKYPKTNKAPDALLKIGMSYQRLSDKDNAKFYLQMLLEDYPDARSAALAKKQLTAIK